MVLLGVTTLFRNLQLTQTKHKAFSFSCLPYTFQAIKKHRLPPLTGLSNCAIIFSVIFVQVQGNLKQALNGEGEGK